MPEHDPAEQSEDMPIEVSASAEAADVSVSVDVSVDASGDSADTDTDVGLGVGASTVPVLHLGAVMASDEIELPEPEESEWPEGTSPYDEDDDSAEQDSGVGAFARRSVLASFVRSGADVVRWALSKTSWSPPGMCQQFTRMAFNVGAGFPTAAAAWAGADKRHPTRDPMTVPRAVPVYWTGGSRGFGHAAVSLGNGLVRSTDWPSTGRVGTARIMDIERAWGHRFVGWTEDINNVTVWQKPRPVIDASMISYAARNFEVAPRSLLLKKAVAKEVGTGSMVLSHGVLGPGFRAQYKLVQQKYLRSLNRKVTAAAADGIPGPASLEWLGKRHGFDVRL
jgi:hypothetical protein